VWTSTPFSANPAGNGLRFGTLYNFRFDAQAAPQMGSVTVEAWKTPGSASGSALVPGVPPVLSYCFGDGSGTACPCGNASVPGATEGCLNSTSQGARLTSTGVASIANDTLALVGTQMTNSSCLYFQGTSRLAGGAGLVFGDGLRCAGGSITRLSIHVNAGGTSQHPSAGGVPISVKGACSAGDVRTYQVWYRNSAPFCMPATFNLTSAVEVSWIP
jgi:hypothetical protein